MEKRDGSNWAWIRAGRDVPSGARVAANWRLQEVLYEGLRFAQYHARI